MSKSSDIQSRIDETMQSIDNISRATPKPFFYTRLEARILKEEGGFWESMSRMMSKPAIAVATISLVLIINVLVFMQGSAAAGNAPKRSEMASVEDLRPTSYYDLENSQP
jgi:hypothetical protein